MHINLVFPFLGIHLMRTSSSSFTNGTSQPFGAQRSLLSLVFFLNSITVCYFKYDFLIHAMTTQLHKSKIFNRDVTA